MRPIPLIAILLGTCATSPACEAGATLDPVARAEALTPAQRERVRQRALVVAHAPGGSALVDGLGELAKAEPQAWGLRTQGGRKPGPGLASFTVGDRSTLGSRIEQTRKLAAQGRLAGADVLTMLPGAGDLPSSRTVEMAYTQYHATLDLSFSSSSVVGWTTEQIAAPRVVNTNGTGTAVLGAATYPLSLPNVQTSGVKTSVRVPAGISGDDVGVAAPAPPTGLAALHPRDPRRALAEYRAGVEALAKDVPGVRVVLATMPPQRGCNLQRTWFNAQVRAQAQAERRPLFDVAALLCSDEAGYRCGRDGEEPAPAWFEGAGSGVNAAGRQRLAKAFWALLATLDEAPADPPASGSHGS
jgi:hypothetical protein